jgi:raffinose/stachyose/melibiose transport system substrate-binding protein
MRRFIAIMLVLVGLTGFAFAAGEKEGGGEAQASGQEQITLDVWSWRTEDVEDYNAMFDVFEENNPGVTVNFRAIKNTEYNTVLATALEGNQGPDVMQLRAYGGLQRYTDFLMPIGDKVSALEEFPGSSVDSARGREDDKIYGVPFANQALGIYYNKRIFEENGVSVPETWDEFIDVMDTLKSNGVTPLANGGKAGWMLEIVFGTIGPNFYGGNEFYQEVTDGETTFTDQRFVNALDRMQELKPYMQSGFMGIDYSSQQAAFFTEQAAMFIGGSFEAAFFQEQNPELEIGVFPAPRPSGQDTTYVGTWADGSYGANANTEHQEAAVELLRFMASQEFGNMFTNRLAQISPVPGVEADPDEVPVLSQFTGMLGEYESTPYIMLVGFRWEKPSGSVVLQNALQGMMQGDMTPQDVADKVQSELATWYDPFQ